MFATGEKIEQQHDAKKETRDERDTHAGEQRQLVGLADPIADSIEDQFDDLIRLYGVTENLNGMIAGCIADKSLQGALQIERQASGLVGNSSRRKDAEQNTDADDDQEETDGKNQPWPACALRQPVDRRRADIGQDRRQDERQQDQLDEIEKYRKRRGCENDRAGFVRVEPRHAAVMLWRGVVVAPLLRGRHEYVRPFQVTRPLSRRRTLSSAMTAPTV